VDTILANRKFKDSIFVKMYNSNWKVISLYNALTGKLYSPDTKVEFTTLSDVLFKDLNNDLAFIIDDKLIILIEHQSTLNNNMPLRLLLYISRVYEQIVKIKDMYRKKGLKIPKPEFIVLYNGIEEDRKSVV
jgi:hypothetical protein